jgi:hypothetical protein
MQRRRCVRCFFNHVNGGGCDWALRRVKSFRAKRGISSSAKRQLQISLRSE